MAGEKMHNCWEMWSTPHMGRFPQDGNFACFVSLLKKPLWPNLICYTHFFIVFIVLWRARLSDYTCSAPTPHQLTTMHCNAFKRHQKCTILCHFNSAFLVNFECIAVQCIIMNWWGVEAEQDNKIVVLSTEQLKKCA